MVSARERSRFGKPFKKGDRWHLYGYSQRWRKTRKGHSTFRTLYRLTRVAGQRGKK